MDLANKTVGDMALEIPGATRVFEKMGIDYCCGGKRSLAGACAAAGVELSEVKSALQLATAPPKQSEEPNFHTATLAELIDHIVEKHHTFTRLELARLGSLIEKVCEAHGKNHPELRQINLLLRELTADLEAHMRKEEFVLFPYIVRMEAAAEHHVALGRPPFGTVANPVSTMMLEHNRAGELLKAVRELSSNYLPPPDACISYQTLYASLGELEKDLHQHIHLENNLLFPRAVEAEPPQSN